MSTFGKYCASPQAREFLDQWNYLNPEEETGCPLCGSGEKCLWYSLGQSNAYTCMHCRMKYISPRLSQTQISEYYNKSFLDKNTYEKDVEGNIHDVIGDSEERRKKIRDRHYEIEITNQFIRKGRVLDIGCSAGLYFEGLKGQFELYGIEMSKIDADYTRKRFNAEIKSCDITEATYPNEYFNVINMTYVIEHLLYPKPVMEKVTTWLKKDGLLLVSSPNWGGIISKIYKEYFRLNDPCQHIILWERNTLEKFIEAHGFRVKKIHFPYFKTEYFNIYEVKRLFRNTLYQVLLPIFIKLKYFPKPEKVFSPPFLGNTMVVEAYKK
jgi:2-polyprenyl-3-methyl-5-hydroxy-6-metoxy-1,4-benzoquinol methylase